MGSSRMWLFTVFGYFSVVLARQGNGAAGAPLDPERVMIRARNPDHLHRLQKQFPQELGTSQIVLTERADYIARLIVSRDKWASVVAALTEELDYGNFKEAAGRKGSDTNDLALLHQVWGVASSWQERVRAGSGDAQRCSDPDDEILFGGAPSDH